MAPVNALGTLSGLSGGKTTIQVSDLESGLTAILDVAIYGESGIAKILDIYVKYMVYEPVYGKLLVTQPSHAPNGNSIGNNRHT